MTRLENTPKNNLRLKKERKATQETNVATSLGEWGSGIAMAIIIANQKRKRAQNIKLTNRSKKQLE